MAQHSHSHSHSHSHPHSNQQNRKILIISFSLISAFMLIEFLAGYMFNSLALIADAGHMANDSFSLLLALIALFASQKNQHRLVLLNSSSLVLVAIYIFYEAYQRLQQPQPLDSLPMLLVAVLGLILNLLVAYLMHNSEEANLNMKAAYMHVLADLLGSVVAIISGLSAWLLGWLWFDTWASLLLALFILRSGLMIMRASWRQIKQPILESSK